MASLLSEKRCMPQLQQAIGEYADLDHTRRHGEMLVVRHFDFALKLLQAGADPGMHRRDPKTGRPQRATLIHYVAAARGRSRSFTEQQHKDYEALVNWFTDRGDSIEQAHRERQAGIQLQELEPEQPNGNGS